MSPTANYGLMRVDDSVVACADVGILLMSVVSVVWSRGVELKENCFSRPCVFVVLGTSDGHFRGLRDSLVIWRIYVYYC